MSENRDLLGDNMDFIASVTAKLNSMNKQIFELKKELNRYYYLYNRINIMMGELGGEGEINSQHAKVQSVMDALHDIDGGTFEEKPVEFEDD